VAASPPAAVLPVEEGRPADARPNRPGENTALADLPIVDQRVERGPRRGVTRAVSRRRDLDHDTGIERTGGPLGELDVPFAVAFDLVDPQHPGRVGVFAMLDVRAGRAG